MRFIIGITIILFSWIHSFTAQNLTPKNLNGKWGAMDDQKNWVIKPKFEEIRKFTEGFAPAKKKGKWGFINAAGKWTVKPIYEEASNFSDGMAGVQQNGLWGFINPVGELKIPFAFSKTYAFKNGIANVILPNMLPRQSILIDATGKQIAPPHLFRTEITPNVFFIVSQKENKDSVFCYVDAQGNNISDWYLNRFEWGKPNQKVAVPASLENDQVPAKTLESNSSKLLYAFLDENAKVISPWFDEIRAFKNGIAPAQKNHRFGFINEQYETLVDFQYLEIRVFDEKRYVAQTLNEGFLLLNLDGSVIGKEFHGFDLFNKERIVAYSMEDFLGKKTYKKALFTDEGEQKSGWYINIYPKSNWYHRVIDERLRRDERGNAYMEKIYNYIVDSTGEVLSDWRPCHEMIWQNNGDRKYNDSIFHFLHQPKSNYYIEETFFENVFYQELKMDGNTIHFEGGDYHDGMAMISEIKNTEIIENNLGEITFSNPQVKYGFIDWYGDVVIPCKYDYISGFSDGKAIFRQNGKYGAIDYKGKVILQPKYDLLGNFGSGIAPYYVDSAWGYISSKGKQVLKPIFEEAHPHRYGMAAVKQNSRWGLIDTQGNMIIGFKYRKPPLVISRNKVRVLVDGIGYEVIDL